jgi:hypothetical protein
VFSTPLYAYAANALQDQLTTIMYQLERILMRKSTKFEKIKMTREKSAGSGNLVPPSSLNE